jgi:hypothetical protein
MSSLVFGQAATDSAGNKMWPLNLVIGDGDSLYAEVTPLLQGYNKGWWECEFSAKEIHHCTVMITASA